MDQPSIRQRSDPREHVLLAYVADLELEVDRVRKQSQFVQHATLEAIRQIRSLCSAAAPADAGQNLTQIDDAAKSLALVLHDLRESPGYHPAHDQVVAIAVRHLIEQVFRWQQRLNDAPYVALRLELESEHMEWFPARLRHILDNLISNALRYRDAAKGETRLTVALRVLKTGYELRISDNGLGMQLDDATHSRELFHRSAPARSAGMGVGLAVVKALIEQSGGTFTTHTGDGQGSSFVAVLPRYEVEDFLT